MINCAIDDILKDIEGEKEKQKQKDGDREIQRETDRERETERETDRQSDKINRQKETMRNQRCFNLSNKKAFCHKKKTCLIFRSI